MKQKILLFDIETTPNVGYTWGKYEQDVIEFKEEGHIMCFAYKWLGGKTQFISEYDFSKNGEYEVTKKLHELFNEADTVVAHNGDSFDIKMANRAFIKHSLPPTKPFISIDTKKIAKNKFRFNSNKLDDLGEYLGLGRKVDTGGFDLWLGCMARDKKSLKLMRKYNIQDVDLLEKVYLKLRGWDNHRHMNELSPYKHICPICGSDKVQSRGVELSGGMIHRRFQCQECGKWSRGNSLGRAIPKEYILK